jgi:putative holliday junction resolvase
MQEKETPDFLPGEDECDRFGVCLGIDYGSKRIGVAVSDQSWKLAFPFLVIQNGPSNKEKEAVFYEIRRVLDAHDVSLMVIGESKNFKGEDNQIMEDVKEFKERILEEFEVETIFEPELFSTIQASRIQGEHDTIDSSAAAVILQSYLDRIQSRNKKKTNPEIQEKFNARDYQESLENTYE